MSLWWIREGPGWSREAFWSTVQEVGGCDGCYGFPEYNGSGEGYNGYGYRVGDDGEGYGDDPNP
jgi:hypothetical protein